MKSAASRRPSRNRLPALLSANTNLSLFDRGTAFGKSCRIGLVFRHRNRQQKIDWHTERFCKLLMQRHRPLSLSGLQVRQITLRDANRHDQFGLGQAAPFTQYTYRIFARRQSIDNSLGQQDLATGRKLCARLAYEAARTNVFVSRQSGQPLVFFLRQNSEFLAAHGFDELDLHNVPLSTVDFPAMPNRNDNNRVALTIEDYAPIPHAQPRIVPALEPLDVALPGLRKRLKLGVKSLAHIAGKFEPLARCFRRKSNLHQDNIAYYDIYVNENIALCDSQVAT